MDELNLRVYGLDDAADTIPLQTLLAALVSAGYPVTLATGITGEASEEELASGDWDAAIVRWMDPEMHEVALIERDRVSESEVTRSVIAGAIQDVANRFGYDPGGQAIITDHLRKTTVVYSVQMLPALLVNDEHAAWGALDVALRCIAAQADGLISVPGEGYCDADGELVLAEEEEMDYEIGFADLEEEPEEA